MNGVLCELRHAAEIELESISQHHHEECFPRGGIALCEYPSGVISDGSSRMPTTLTSSTPVRPSSKIS